MNLEYYRWLGVIRIRTSFSLLERIIAPSAGTPKPDKPTESSLLSPTGHSKPVGIRTTPTSSLPHRSTVESQSKRSKTPAPIPQKPMRIKTKRLMVKTFLHKRRLSPRSPLSRCPRPLDGLRGRALLPLASVVESFRLD